MTLTCLKKRVNFTIMENLNDVNVPKKRVNFMIIENLNDINVP